MLSFMFTLRPGVARAASADALEDEPGRRSAIEGCGTRVTRALWAQMWIYYWKGSGIIMPLKDA